MRIFLRKFITFLSFFSFFFILSCDNQNLQNLSEKNTELNVEQSENKPDKIITGNVYENTVTLTLPSTSRGTYTKDDVSYYQIYFGKSIDNINPEVKKPGETISFTFTEEGTYTLLVNAFNSSGLQIATGTVTQELKFSTTPILVTVTMKPGTYTDIPTEGWSLGYMKNGTISTEYTLFDSSSTTELESGAAYKIKLVNSESTLSEDVLSLVNSSNTIISVTDANSSTVETSFDSLSLCWGFTVPAASDSDTNYTINASFANDKFNFECSAEFVVKVSEPETIVTEVTTFEELKDAIGKDGDILIMNDIKMTSGLTINYNVNIRSNGKFSLIRDTTNTAAPLFLVMDDKTLTIGDDAVDSTKTLTLDGGLYNTDDSGDIVPIASSTPLINSMGNLVLKYNCQIYGNTNNGSTYSGGGVLITNGTLVTDGAVFNNNIKEDSGDGGALSISAKATSVSIKNTLFSENFSNATGGTGGAIYIAEVSCDVNIENCEFGANTAYSYGGAIRSDMNSGYTLNLINCKFANNTVATDTFNIRYESSAGGAVYINSGNLTVNGISVANNTSNKITDSNDDIYMNCLENPTITIKGLINTTLTDSEIQQYFNFYLLNGTDGAYTYTTKTGVIETASISTKFDFQYYKTGTFLTAEDGVTLADYTKYYSLKDSTYSIGTDGAITQP